MRRTRYFAQVCAISIIVMVFLLWRMARLGPAPAIPAAASALILSAVSVGKLRSRARRRGLIAGWAIVAGTAETISIISFASHADAAVALGFAALALIAAVAIVWTVRRRRRSRGRYVSGYFVN